MTLKQLYNSIGGDYDDVVKRLISEELVSRFVARFFSDESFSLLYGGMNEQNANTVKGTIVNDGSFFGVLIADCIGKFFLLVGG